LPYLFDQKQKLVAYMKPQVLFKQKRIKALDRVLDCQALIEQIYAISVFLNHPQ
jgi:hypothetical protein